MLEGILSTLIGGNQVRNEGNASPPTAAPDEADTIMYEGRAWPRDGAARYALMRALTERAHAEGKARIAALESALVEARERLPIERAVPGAHERAVNAIVINELERAARNAIEPAWAGYLSTDSDESFTALSAALRALRQREIHELGERTCIVAGALLKAADPHAASHGDRMIVLAGEIVRAALLDSRPALRDAVGALVRMSLRS